MKRQTHSEPISKVALFTKILRSKQTSVSSKWSRLLICAIFILLGWTQLLPRLETFGTIRAYIERMQQQGINPSALYYTEHPASRDWERTIHERMARNPKAFWVPK